MILLLLLQLLAVVHGCSTHKSVTCHDEIIANRSNYKSDAHWDANPALRYDYQYTQTNSGLFTHLKAIWRVLKSEKFAVPLTAFEISLLDLTANRLIEVRSVSITLLVEGIRQLTDTVEFFTHFNASLDFGHEYEIELRFLPLGTGGSFKRQLSIPSLPASGDCERDSALAQDKDKYAISVSEIRRNPYTAAVLLAFHTAPPVFCFSEYTIEVLQSANPIAVYATVIVAPTASTQVIKHEFIDLPVGIHLSIKIYPTEAIHSRASQCVCRHCNCLVTQTVSFKFAAPAVKDTSNLEAPLMSSDSFFGQNLTNFVLLALMLLLIAMLALITWFLRRIITASKSPPANVTLVSEWNREEKEPIVASPEVKHSGSIWIIGLNNLEEQHFLYKLSSHLHPSTRLIYAPDDLLDGENRWQWMADVNRDVDSILLLLCEYSLSLFSAGISSTSDPIETIFIEQMTLLHPSDHRIMMVSLDACNPSLFYSSSILFRDPRDFSILTQCLSHRGFLLADNISSPPSPLIPALANRVLPLADSRSLTFSPPISLSLSLRTETLREIRDQSVRSESESSEEQSSKDSGFVSNPSSPSILQRSAFPFLDQIDHGHIPSGDVVVAN